MIGCSGWELPYLQRMFYAQWLEFHLHRIDRKTCGLICREIAYFDEGRDEAKKSKKGLTIAVPFTTLGANTKVNSVIADLNTILGAGTVDALPTS